MENLSDDDKKFTQDIEFNDEVIWDNNRKLFDKHFKSIIKRNQHQLVDIKERNKYDTFDKIIEELKTRVLNKD